MEQDTGALEPDDTVLERDTETAHSRWTVAPYLWLLSFKGDAAIDDIHSDVDISFTDALTDSDSLFAIMAQIEYDADLFSLFLRSTFVHSKFEDQGGSIGGIDVELDVETNVGWFDLGVAVPIVDPTDPSIDAEQHQSIRLDGYGGVRFTIIDLDLDTNAAVAGIPLVDTSDELTEFWAEPFVGLRTSIYFTNRWHLYTSVDVGGFGAGSDLAWRAEAVIGFQFSIFDNPAAGYFGYSALSQDYESDDFEWDVVAHGPLLGFQIQF